MAQEKYQETEKKVELEEEEQQEQIFEDELTKRMGSINMSNDGIQIEDKEQSADVSGQDKGSILLSAEQEVEFITKGINNVPQNQHIYYILSKKWLGEWEMFIKKKKEESECYEVKPEFNTDLVEEEEEEEQVQSGYNYGNYNYSSNYSYNYNYNYGNNKKEKKESHKFVQMQTKLGGDILNKYIKETVEEGDYVVVGKELMEYVAQHYRGVIIARKNSTQGLQVKCHKAQVIIITNQILRQIDQNKQNSLKVYQCQYAPDDKLSHLLQRCKQYVNDNYKKIINTYAYSQIDTTVTDQQIRLWRLHSSLDSFFQYLQKCTKANISFNYNITMNGQYLGQQMDTRVGQVVQKEEAEEKKEGKQKKQEEEEEEDEEMKRGAEEGVYLVMDLRESKNDWNLVQKGLPGLNRCDNCKDYFMKEMVKCMCNDVGYCSKRCQQQDMNYHQMRCDRAGEEAEEVDEDGHFLKKSGAKMGLVGLMNLGNTCYMNSALQCLSNMQEVTSHFLNRKYVGEINLDNPLGSQGKLAEKYAQLLRNLHYEPNNTFNPFAIKRAVGKLNAMFGGYGQQDSSEFLYYILDGLHEDINRVKVKPITENIESNGTQNDHQIAAQSWANYQKRNQSVIIDNFYGQFKSKLRCPICDKISITFDPFAMVSLPVPNRKKKDLDFFYIHKDNHVKPYRMKVEYDVEKDTMHTIKQKVQQKLNKQSPMLFITLSYSEASPVIPLEHKADVVRKKNKNKNFFAIEYLEQPPHPVEVVFQMNQYNESPYPSYNKSRINKKAFTFARILTVDYNMTLKQLHMEIFNFNRIFFDEYGYQEMTASEIEPMSDQVLFDKIFKGEGNSMSVEGNGSSSGLDNETYRPYEVKLLNKHTQNRGILMHHRKKFSCPVCQDNNCEMQCYLPYDHNTTVGQMIHLQAKLDEHYANDMTEKESTGVKKRLDIEVIWNMKLPNKHYDLGRLNNCQTFKETLKPQEADEKIDIYKCLDQFEEIETLGEDNAWYCSTCKTHQKANKQMQIYKAPKILVCHLKRFKISSGHLGYGNSHGKINSYIDCPQTLDMTKYVLNQNLPNENEQYNQENKLLYELIAISNHYGNAGGGHYTAFAKSGNNQWYEFDDSRVTQTDKDSVVTEAAYLLFYKRKQ